MRGFYFVFFLFFIAKGFSQEYKPLLDNFNEWHIINCFNGCLTDKYYTDGDTLVGGKNYKILDGFHYVSRGFLLREDIQAKKVYLNLLMNNRSEEFLLYDFALEVGDSIEMRNPMSPFPTNGRFYQLDSIINRALVDGNEYKHYYFTPTPSNTISSTPATWIEGVGSLSLINAPGGFPDINGVGILSCFFKEGQLFYADFDVATECEPTILTNNIKNSLDSVTLNTLIKEECIVTNAKMVRTTKVYDLQGRIISTLLSDNQSYLEIDFSAMSKGIYFIELTSEGGERKVFKVLVK